MGGKWHVSPMVCFSSEFGDMTQNGFSVSVAFFATCCKIAIVSCADPYVFLLVGDTVSIPQCHVRIVARGPLDR